MLTNRHLKLNLKPNVYLPGKPISFTNNNIVRIGWIRFRECEEPLLGNRFPLRMKVYRYCVRSAIMCESEAWYLKENEKAILRGTKRTMVRAMCGQRVVDKKTTEE